MKTTFAILTCLAAATTALVIPPSDQTPLLQDEPLAVAEQASAVAAAAQAPAVDQVDDFPVLLIIRPTETETEPEAVPDGEAEKASDALPALLVDGPTADAPRAADDDDVVVVGEYADEEDSGSCFCAGGAVCCVRDGETDCGFGVCGI